jgi:hypothetical protein
MADIPSKLIELNHLTSALCVGIDIVDPSEMRAEIDFGSYVYFELVSRGII